VARLEGRWALAAFVEHDGLAADRSDARPDYFILLQVQGDRVTAIRDYRYVAYIAAEAEFDLTPSPTKGTARE